MSTISIPRLDGSQYQIFTDNLPDDIPTLVQFLRTESVDLRYWLEIAVCVSFFASFSPLKQLLFLLFTFV